MGNLTNDQRAGADAWITGSYDPELNTDLLGHGTGQAVRRRSSAAPRGDACSPTAPWRLIPIPERWPGISQNAPGESLDLDEVYERVLVDHGLREKTVQEVGARPSTPVEAGPCTNRQDTSISTTAPRNRLPERVWVKLRDKKTRRPADLSRTTSFDAEALGCAMRLSLFFFSPARRGATTGRPPSYYHIARPG
jgi:hypothetical protein